MAAGGLLGARPVAHHQVPQSCQGQQETPDGAQGHGEESPVPDPGRHPLPPRQLGAAPRPQARQHPRDGRGQRAGPRQDRGHGLRAALQLPAEAAGGPGPGGGDLLVPRPRAAARRQALHQGHRHLGHRLHLRRAADQRTHLPLPAGGHQDQQPVPPRPAGQDLPGDGVPPGEGLGGHEEDAGAPHPAQGLQEVQLHQLLAGEVHGPPPDKARVQSVPAAAEAPDHGPDEALHQRAGHGGRVFQGGAAPHPGRVRQLSDPVPQARVPVRG